MAIIIKPIVTEKMTQLGEKLNRYGFKVQKNANKIEIKQAVEAMYNVTVTDVNTLIVAPKVKSRFTKSGVVTGKKAAYKKAVVTVKEGEQIDFYTVTRAPFHGQPELGKPAPRTAAIFRNHRLRAYFAEMDGQPQPIDALVRQPVQIFIGIVIYVVGQFVAIFRRAVDRAEKAAGYARADDRTALRHAHGQERAPVAQKLVLNEDQSATDSFRIPGQNPAFPAVHLDPVRFRNFGHRQPGRYAE